MADPPPSPDKAYLRASLRRRRRTFVDGLGPRRTPLERDVMGCLRQRLGPARCVAIYRAHGAELSPASLAVRPPDGMLLALPRVVEGGGLDFHAWRAGQALIVGAHGIEEPEPEAATVLPDVILLPLLGFDRAGSRLGQGGGHYDRTLARMPDARRIGLAWSVQEVERVPVDPWDMRLHAVITEEEWIEC